MLLIVNRPLIVKIPIMYLFELYMFDSLCLSLFLSQPII